MEIAFLAASIRRWSLLGLIALLAGGCYGFRPIAHEEIANAGMVRLTSSTGVELHQLSVGSRAAAPTCRAHRVSGRVSRVRGDSIIIVRISDVTPVAGSEAFCRNIVSASLVNEGPERLVIERARLRPAATLATTTVVVLASATVVLILAFASAGLL